MGEKLADRDASFSIRCKFRQVARDRRIEIEFAALDELHDRRGRGDDLGQRSRVVNCVLRNRLRRRHERALAIGLAINFALTFEPQDTAWEFLRRDCIGHRRVERRELLRFEGGCRGLGWRLHGPLRGRGGRGRRLRRAAAGGKKRQDRTGDGESCKGICAPLPR